MRPYLDGHNRFQFLVLDLDGLDCSLSMELGVGNDSSDDVTHTCDL